MCCCCGGISSRRCGARVARLRNRCDLHSSSGEAAAALSLISRRNRPLSPASQDDVDGDGLVPAVLARVRHLSPGPLCCCCCLLCCCVLREKKSNSRGGRTPRDLDGSVRRSSVFYTVMNIQQRAPMLDKSETQGEQTRDSCSVLQCVCVCEPTLYFFEWFSSAA